MQVILNTSRVVGRGLIQDAGDTVEMPDDEARRYLARGMAEPVPRENATTGPTNNATLHPQPRTPHSAAEKRNRRHDS